MIHGSRSQKRSSAGAVRCPLSWEKSALRNIKCMWKGTLSTIFLFSELLTAPLSPEVRAGVYFFLKSWLSVSGRGPPSPRERETLYSSLSFHVKSVVACAQGLSSKGRRHGSSNSPSL